MLCSIPLGLTWLAGLQPAHLPLRRHVSSSFFPLGLFAVACLFSNAHRSYIGDVVKKRLDFFKYPPLQIYLLHTFGDIHSIIVRSLFSHDFSGTSCCRSASEKPTTSLCPSPSLPTVKLAIPRLVCRAPQFRTDAYRLHASCVSSLIDCPLYSSSQIPSKILLGSSRSKLRNSAAASAPATTSACNSCKLVPKPPLLA